MAKADDKQKLVHFLEQNAFQPVMRADPDKFPGNKRDQVRDMQRRTQSEIERFQNYDSPEEVVTNFKRDLTSEPAKKVHRELKSLGLPTLGDVRKDFESLAHQLGY